MTKYLFEIAETIAQGLRNKEHQKNIHQNYSEIEKEINYLFENRSKAIEMLHIVFPDGKYLNPEFYKKLSDIQYYLKFKPKAYLLTGFLWVEAYKLLPQPSATELLRLLIDYNGSINISSVIHSLPAFLSEIELSPDFASSWFYSFVKKVGRDFASNGVYQAVENYAFNFPTSGLKVFEKYISQELDENRLHLSAIILGSLRASSETDRVQKETLERWNNKLINNPHTEMRICYHRSWLIPFWRGLVSIDQLETKLTLMMEGSQEEKTEAFSVLHKCLLSNLKNEYFLKYSLQWLNKNVSNRISDIAKYYVTHSIFMLNSEIKIKQDYMNDAINLIIKIQPVSCDNSGIWEDIEHYLVDLLNAGKESFYNILTKLLEANFEGLSWHIKNSKFEYLLSKTTESDIGSFITDLMISFDNKKRLFGFLLFQKTKISSFDENTLKKAQVIQLHLLLLESIRNPFSSEDASRFFIMLEPYFQDVSTELKNEFKDEMVTQAINYPGKCLNNWKKINTPSNLIKDVIESAEQYFKKLENISQSAAISFTFPELKNSFEIERREFSKKVSKGAQEESILASLCKKVDIIYGNQWCIMVGDKLGDPTALERISHSVELPRLELIDPEGMTIRRMRATAQIKEYDKERE